MSIVQQPRALARKFYIERLLDTELTWRYGLNPRETLQFRRNAPALEPEAKRVLADLNANGAARTTLDALTGDSSLLAQLQAEAARLEDAKREQVEEKARLLASGVDLGNGYDKAYVATLLDPDRPEIDPSGIWATLMMHPQMKGVADHYYGMTSYIRDINIWRNLPTKQGPVASQRWHRDEPEDHMILKTFVYLEEVTEGAGPFSYVKGTHGKGRRKWQPPVSFDGHNWRADDEEMLAVTSNEERDTFVGPAGTVLFADTFGWHKGGEAKTKSRLVMQGLFASRSALPDRLLGIPAGVDVSSAPSILAYDRR